MFADSDHSSRGLMASVLKRARTDLTCSIESTPTEDRLKEDARKR